MRRWTSTPAYGHGDQPTRDFEPTARSRYRAGTTDATSTVKFNGTPHGGSLSEIDRPGN